MKYFCGSIVLAMLCFVGSAACLAESAGEWYFATKSQEHDLERSLRLIRAETYEAVSSSEKKDMRDSLRQIKSQLAILNWQISALKAKKFAEGAPEEWMGLIQIIQDLQLSNELDRRDLRKILAGK